MAADARSGSLTATVVSLLMWGTPGHSTAADGVDAQGTATSRSEFVRHIKHSPHLRANVSNTERYVVDGVCETRGIQQIAEILRRSEFEEMWAFLPRAHATQACQWHEIGREEKSESDGSYVHVDRKYLERLMAGNAEIHLYHFHPLRYFECAAHADCPKDTQDRYATLDQRWITDLVFSMPSPSDIHFMMDVTWHFHRYHANRGVIKHRVVTPYGVVDYGLTDEGLARFDWEKDSRSGGLYIAWVVGAALADDRVEQLVKDRPGSIAGAVRSLAQTLNTEFLQVVHSPLTRDAERTLAAPDEQRRVSPGSTMTD